MFIGIRLWCEASLSESGEDKAIDYGACPRVGGFGDVRSGDAFECPVFVGAGGGFLGEVGAICGPLDKGFALRFGEGCPGRHRWFPVCPEDSGQAKCGGADASGGVEDDAAFLYRGCVAASAVFGEEGSDGLFEVVALGGGWLCDRFFGPGDLGGYGFVGRDGGEDAGCKQQRDTGEQEVFR